MSVHYAHRVNVIEEPRSMYSHEFSHVIINVCVRLYVNEGMNRPSVLALLVSLLLLSSVYLFKFFYSSQIEWEHTRNAYYEISQTHSHCDACVLCTSETILTTSTLSITPQKNSFLRTFFHQGSSHVQLHQSLNLKLYKNHDMNFIIF